MIIKVFDVGDKVEYSPIDSVQKENILKIFENLQKEYHLVTHCFLDYDSDDYQKSPIYYLNEERDSKGFSFERVAKDLLEAERKKDGTRNSTIKEGLLFIKINDPHITIMKLEKMSVIDKITYEFKKELGSEKDYFKSCIFKGNYDDVKVIDKNRTAARYWYKKFLKLTRKRTEEDNTSDLIELIETDKLYKQEVIKLPNYGDIKKITERYILEKNKFDKSELMNELSMKGMLENISEFDVYSDESKKIDTDFFLSQRVINEKYQLEIPISDNVTIKTKNYLITQEDRTIHFDEKNKMIRIIIDERYLNSVKEKLCNVK